MGWRFVFAGILPLALLITILSLFLLKNVGEQKNPHLDILSVLLSILAFGGLLYGFSSASTLGWSHPLLIISVVVGAICFVWFIRRQFHLKEPLLELRIMKIPAFTYSAIINMIINASLIVGTILLPIYLQNVLGYSAFVTGMVTVPSSVLMAIMSPISGMLFDRFGPRGIGILGMFLLTISMIGLALMGLKTTLVYIIAMMICQALGLNLANMPINTWGINALDNDYIAHGNAITNTGRQIAGSLSTGILITVMTMVTMANSAVGQVQATLSGIQVAYALAAVLAAAGLLIVILKVRHTQSIAKEIGMEA